MNSLSGISDLSLDTLILIFLPHTPPFDYHQLQPLSVYQMFEKIMKVMKKPRKFMLFYVDTSTVDKGFLRLFHPSTNFSNHPSFLKFGKSRPPPPPPPLLPFLKGNMIYTILYNTNDHKYSWSQLISLSILHILCVHRETTATLLFTV